MRMIRGLGDFAAPSQTPQNIAPTPSGQSITLIDGKYYQLPADYVFMSAPPDPSKYQSLRATPVYALGNQWYVNNNNFASYFGYKPIATSQIVTPQVSASPSQVVSIASAPASQSSNSSSIESNSGAALPAIVDSPAVAVVPDTGVQSVTIPWGLVLSAALAIFELS